MCAGSSKVIRVELRAIMCSFALDKTKANEQYVCWSSGLLLLLLLFARVCSASWLLLLHLSCSNKQQAALALVWARKRRRHTHKKKRIRERKSRSCCMHHIIQINYFTTLLLSCAASGLTVRLIRSLPQHQMQAKLISSSAVRLFVLFCAQSALIGYMLFVISASDAADAADANHSVAVAAPTSNKNC